MSALSLTRCLRSTGDSALAVPTSFGVTTMAGGTVPTDIAVPPSNLPGARGGEVS